MTDHIPGLIVWLLGMLCGAFVLSQGSWWDVLITIAVCAPVFLAASYAAKRWL